MGQVFQVAQIPFLSEKSAQFPHKGQTGDCQESKKAESIHSACWLACLPAGLLADGLAGLQPHMYPYGKLMGEMAGRGDVLLGYMTGSQTIAALGLSICL